MKLKQIALLILWVTVAGCRTSVPSTEPKPHSPTPIAATVTVLPSATPTLTVTPTPTLHPTPTPTSASRWECYQGGLGCYESIQDLSMLDAQRGWAVGGSGVILHFTTSPENPEPTWQRVYTPWLDSGFTKVSAVVPDEWWGIRGGGLIHYQSGAVERVLLETDQKAEDVSHLLDLSVIAPDDVWVVGNQGVIIRYHQGEIVRTEFPEDYQLGTITMLNAEEGWAAGRVLLHYQNGRWEEASLSPIENGFHGSKIELVGDEVWLLGTRNALFRYRDGEWQEVPGMLEGGLEQGIAAVDISMVSETEGWVITNNPQLLHYHEGQWERIDSPTQNTLRAIQMINAEEGWAVGDNSTVLHYLDGFWQVVSEGFKPQWGLTIDWVEDEGWIAGSTQSISHYKNGEWQTSNPNVSPTLNVRLNGIDMISKTEGWAVGREGTMLHYAEGRWQLVPTDFEQTLEDVDFANETEGWTVGEDGVIIHIVDGELIQTDSPTQKWLTTIDMVDEQEGWVLGLDGTLLHYQNGVWQAVEPLLEQNYQIKMIDKDNGWIIGSQDGESVILHYDGTRWQPVEYPQGYSLSAMDMLDSEEGWIIAKEGILHYQAGAWDIIDNPARAGMAKLIMLNETDGWAVGGDGILHYTNE